ncbi:anti-sigma factor family protein [Micromonospora radicis]|nr:zf-HC2 domain-containing protein [Micromonospora radicis]
MSAQRCVAGGERGREQLARYLLGSLSADEEFEVEAHLLRCAGCRAVAAGLSEVAASVATLPPTAVRALEAGGLDADTDPTTTPGTTQSRGGDPGHRFRRILRYAVVLLVGVLLGAGGLALAGLSGRC